MATSSERRPTDVRALSWRDFEEILILRR